MKKDKYYIGKVEKICNISKKTLRFYDKIGLLTPDEIVSTNSYRYYSKEDLYNIPIIKYYKQSGFELEKIKKLIHNHNLEFIESSFKEKISELEELEKTIELKKKSLEGWHTLIKEGEMIINNNLSQVNIKYLEKNSMLFLDQEFKNDYLSTIINIDFTNYIEAIQNSVVGPVIIQFPCFEDKLNRKCRKIRILQKNLIKCEAEKLCDFGDELVVSCYHIGSYETIEETYKKIKDWMKIHNYKIQGIFYERYIVDYWINKDIKKFVTEVMVKIQNIQ